MIVESRHYTLNLGCREKFIDFFESSNRGALRDSECRYSAHLEI